MNSIDQNQSEKNHQDLQGLAAITKIREFVDRAKTCFFCTVASSDSEGARPMTVLKVDDRGHLWFLSASDSHKNQELAQNPSVTLYFQASTHTDFLRLSGRAVISADRVKIEELWSPLFATWFTGGKDDPRIRVIEVVPSEGYYWDTKHGIVVAGIKMVMGAILGKTMDDSVAGRLTV